ncbi:MAG: hypothetical protein FWE04_02485 [Oscillospiraceae bacterium]|nr:hypothetical protein [Oscillospiraceae bacterium]
MKMKRITNADLHGRGVWNQPDTPGLDRLEMQRKVEEIAREVIIPVINDNSDTFEQFAENTDNRLDEKADKTDLQSQLDEKADRSELAAERTARIAGDNELQTNLNAHSADNVRHINVQERANWNNMTPITMFNTHNNDNVRHITGAERNSWNNMTPVSTFNAHDNNNVRHITAQERTNWNSMTPMWVFGNHTNDFEKHLSLTDRETWNANIKMLDEVLDNVRTIAAGGTGGFAGGWNAGAGNGGAVGRTAMAEHGFAGGASARSMSNNNIQLGSGENIDELTFQVYQFCMMNSDGTIPPERIPQIGDISASLTAILGV